MRVSSRVKKAFGCRKVGGISADDIEIYLPRRLQERVRIKTIAGFVQQDSECRGSKETNHRAGVEFLVAIRSLLDRASAPDEIGSLVTHDIEEAVSMCDRILVLSSNPGRIAAESGATVS